MILLVRLLVLWGINTLALIVVDWMFDSVEIGRWGSLLLGAAVLTIGNVFLKPMEPADDQQTARPSGAVMVTMVLLNVAWMQAMPCGTLRRSRFFLNSFLRLAGFAAGAAVAS